MDIAEALVRPVPHSGECTALCGTLAGSRILLDGKHDSKSERDSGRSAPISPTPAKGDRPDHHHSIYSEAPLTANRKPFETQSLHLNRRDVVNCNSPYSVILLDVHVCSPHEFSITDFAVPFHNVVAPVTQDSRLSIDVHVKIIMVN
jgi:hypothetical protein